MAIAAAVSVLEGAEELMVIMPFVSARLMAKVELSFRTTDPSRIFVPGAEGSVSVDCFARK